MNTQLIVSVVGPDRPGLVEQISAAVTEVGGNWEGSRMMQLSGQFAGMVQVILPDDRVDDLRERLAEHADETLRIEIIPAATSPAPTDSHDRHILLEVVGQDRSGIVASISRALASAGVNVAELATDCRNAPWSGDRVFETHAVLELPSDLEIELDDLRARIEEISGDLMVDLKPEPV